MTTKIPKKSNLSQFFKRSHYEQDQAQEPIHVERGFADLLEPESDIWLYIDLFNSLDLSSFYNWYSSEGELPKDPRMMLRTIFYGLTHGIVSGRKLESASRYDIRFIILSGKTKPDQRTFTRFLERHEPQFLELFIKVIQTAQKMGLVRLGAVAIDGSRFKANTNAEKGMTYGNMEKAIDKIKQEIKALKQNLSAENKKENSLSSSETSLPSEIKDKQHRLEKIQSAKEAIEHEYKKTSPDSEHQQGDEPPADLRRSLHDPDALALSSRNQAFMHGYNTQIVVDQKNQIILAADIHSCATDYQALPNLLEQAKENCNSLPETVLADMGYQSIQNIRYVKKQLKCKAVIAIESYKAHKRREYQSIQIPLKPSEMVVPGISDREYYCPKGKRLVIDGVKKSGVTFIKITPQFHYECDCSLHSYPFLPKAKTFTLPPRPDLLMMNEYLKEARSKEFNEALKQRKAIVEPVFANLKYNKNFRLFRRGLLKAKAWIKLISTAHNVEKIIHWKQELRDFQCKTA